MALGWELVSFPFVFYRDFLLERKYGLSSEPLRRGCSDHLQGARRSASRLTIVGGLRRLRGHRAGGRRVVARRRGLFFAAAVLLLSRIGARPADAALLPVPSARARGAARAAPDAVAARRRAGPGRLRVGARRKDDARERGAGRRRGDAGAILVSDTLLKDYSDDEIEVILAHELAHHVHHDIWTALALETLVVAAALYAAHIVVAATGRRRHRGPARPPGAAADDPGRRAASAPAHADRQRLVAAQRAPRRPLRAGADRPPRRVHFRHAPSRRAEPRRRRIRRRRLWFFHTHPTIDERIAAARDFTAA